MSINSTNPITLLQYINESFFEQYKIKDNYRDNKLLDIKSNK